MEVEGEGRGGLGGVVLVNLEGVFDLGDVGSPKK